jgi:hypothetical protein
VTTKTTDLFILKDEFSGMRTVFQLKKKNKAGGQVLKGEGSLGWGRNVWRMLRGYFMEKVTTVGGLKLGYQVPHACSVPALLSACLT